MELFPSLNDLPSELIVKIFSHLDYRDLNHCKLLNKRFHLLSKEECHWKRLCQKYWLETTCPNEYTWEKYFIHCYKDMGRYIHCFATLKKTWEKITTFFKVNCPNIFQTIKGGLSEEQLDQAEQQLGLGKLPLDMRCSYRMHNGQRLTSPGIMGSTMSLPGHFRSESLLDLDTILVGFREREGLKGCIPLTLCLHSGVIQFLALTDDDGYEPNTIFYPVQSDGINRKRSLDAFISGSSFLDWITTHANHLPNDDFVIIRDQPCHDVDLRFFNNTVAEETTGFITVSVATRFLPDVSKINPPKFYHTYRITMSMSPEALDSESCQLETRHWTITDESGAEEHVDGPGVVGEYPIMFPGASFSWFSSTNFNTTYGNMKGFFRMRNLQTGDLIEVKCPIFHMKCYPYITSEEREATKARKRVRVF